MIKLPEGLSIKDLKDQFDTAMIEYSPAFKRAQILDGTDRGKLWKAIQAKFPNYQILPDTNHVSFVKSNLLASIYSVGRVPDVLPTSEDDVQAVTEINVFMEHIWDLFQVPYYQMLAGDRAALLNVGYTQVGWDNSPTLGTGEMFKKGTVAFKNLDPLRFMRDPFVDNLHDGSFCVSWDDFHENTIKAEPDYKKEMEEYLAKRSGHGVDNTSVFEKHSDKSKTKNKKYHRVYVYFVKYGENDKIAEIHVVNNEHVLWMRPEIKPNAFPIAELFCNIPAGDVFGTSEPNKIFANSLAYNLMNSIALTSEYKNQRPPRYVNQSAGIDLRSFVKHGNDSDRTFIVQGDASKAVHYHQFPQVSPTVTAIAGGLGVDIKSMSGVTDKYTGQDTGSLLTTGGMSQMVDMATMVDQPKVNNYERYTKQLAYLVLGNLIQYGKERKYLVKDKKTGKFKVISVDFTDIKDINAFEFALEVSPYLPKNRQRIAQMANAIMEKQMQYASTGGGRVNLMTPEEWLMFQDMPFKEYMQERMGLERSTDYIEKASQVIFQYAQLIENGVEPEQAMLVAAEGLEKGLDERSTMGSSPINQATQ